MSRFVTCNCQHCNKHIEFDAESLDKGGTSTASCPHCGLETILFVPQGAQGDLHKFPGNKSQLEQRQASVVVAEVQHRKDFLKHLRANSNYAALRTIINVAFWLTLFVMVFLPCAGYLAVMIMGGLSGLGGGVEVVGGSFLLAAYIGLAVVLIIAARQSLLLLIDLADSNLALAAERATRGKD